MSQDENSPAAPTVPAGPGAVTNLVIHKIYVKDVSFESPNAPVVFNESWQPQADINVQNTARKVGEGIYEVVLSVTVTARVGDKVGFLVEVQQAGLFGLEVPDDEAARPIIAGACPGILYPYAREVISSLVGHGGFPALYLAPADFNALFQQRATAPSDA
jgi:preprotein translocase subunit SecB